MNEKGDMIAGKIENPQTITFGADGLFTSTEGESTRTGRYKSNDSTVALAYDDGVTIICTINGDTIIDEQKSYTQEVNGAEVRTPAHKIVYTKE